MDFGLNLLENMSQAIWYNQWTMKKFSPYLKGEILEVGCGIGNFTKSLTQYGNVWAIDINKKYLKRAKKQAELKAHLGIGDIEKGSYFFGQRSFNTIVCLNVLEHIEQDSRALQNMYKLLKPKGFLVILVPIHPFLYGKIDRAIGHIRRYKPKDFLDLLKKCSFTIRLSQKINFVGALGWWVRGKIFNNSSVGGRELVIFDLFAKMILPIEDRIKIPFGTSVLAVAQKK